MRIILYIPEEHAQPIRGWAEVATVYAMRLRDILIDVFDDTAFAFCNFYFKADIRRKTEMFEINGRNTFILRRVPGNSDA